MDKLNKEYKEGKKAAKSYIEKYPFLKEIWEETEEARENFYALLDKLEERMEKLALEHGIKNIKFAYLGGEGPGPFGIDIGDVESKGQNIKKGRILIHDSDFWGWGEITNDIF